jgi:hypothetical protein
MGISLIGIGSNNCIGFNLNLKGGRGGGGALFETEPTDGDTSDYDGGDGGAGFAIMAPQITVKKDATINLNGLSPDATIQNTNDNIIIPPERGMGGNFGFISGSTDEYESDVDVNTVGVNTTGRISGAKLGRVKVSEWQ